MAASLRRGLLLRPQNRDDSTAIQRLERNTTMETAVATASLAGSLSLGIVNYGEGFAIRFTPQNRREVLARLRSDVTKVCCREVKLAEANKGKYYLGKGASKGLRGKTVIS